MRQVIRGRAGAPVWAFLLLLVAGCGGKTVKIEGRVVQNGQPYKPGPGEKLNLSFNAPTGDKGASAYAAEVRDDGSFVVAGPGGKGIPPGSYKVNVNLTLAGNDPASMAKAEAATMQVAQVNGKEVEITAEPVQELTIDLSKGTVGK